MLTSFANADANADADWKKNKFFFNFSNVDADESADADANADANAEVNANGESGIPIEKTFVSKICFYFSYPTPTSTPIGKNSFWNFKKDF